MNKFLIIFTLFIASCSMEPIPSDKYYQLNNLKSENEFSDTQINKDFRIKKTKSLGVFNSQEILFYNSDNFQKYNTFLWVDRPSNMIDRIFIEKISNSKPFTGNLIDQEDRAKSDLDITITILEIYHGINGQKSRVTLSIDLYNHEEKQKFFSNTLVKEFITSDDLSSFVSLANTEINQILDSFLVDITNLYN